MKKQILFFATAAALAFGAVAQPNDQNPPPDAPRAYGNSGWTPDQAYGQPQPRRGYAEDRRDFRERDRQRARELERERARAREIERQRERERIQARMRAQNRDRDRDGVPDRFDSRPNNPNRR